MSFFAPAFDLAPDEINAVTIAHELAHVYKWATGVNVPPSTGGYDADEQDTDQIVLQWGFDVLMEASWWTDLQSNHPEVYAKVR